MIHEEICTYEVCKLAKEKGFDGSGCLKHYDQNGLLRSNRSFSRFDLTIEELYKHDTPNEVQVYAPTQSLLQRWLREGKNLYISIIAHAKSKSVYYEWEVRYISALGNMNKASSVMTIETYRYNTYELALEDALKYALENLV